MHYGKTLSKSKSMWNMCSLNHEALLFQRALETGLIPWATTRIAIYNRLYPEHPPIRWYPLVCDNFVFWSGTSRWSLPRNDTFIRLRHHSRVRILGVVFQQVRTSEGLTDYCPFCGWWRGLAQCPVVAGAFDTISSLLINKANYKCNERMACQRRE